MKILWFTWKDGSHPLAGGAEIVNEELAKRLVADGNEVVFIVGGHSGCSKTETHSDGYKIFRLGNKWSVYWKAWRFYRSNYKGWADLVIEEVNTIPFFTKFYTKERKFIIVHQLARKVWFYQMVFPLSLIGYLIEPLYLWLISDQKTITISESSKQDLMKNGFNGEQIHIITMGSEMTPVKDPANIKKYTTPTLLSLGAIRPMKRTLHQVKAFEIAKKNNPNLKLKIAGDTSGSYATKVLKHVQNSKYSSDIEVLGRVTKKEKKLLMQKSYAILVTSVKEGWGLIVTEATSQGTPAVVYNVDGLRDSVKNNKTGLVCSKNSPKELANNITLFVQDHKRYNSIRNNAWLWSKKINFNQTYSDFKLAINN
jgi:glycosyltransferase involved in cell wall biosynthesis